MFNLEKAVNEGISSSKYLFYLFWRLVLPIVPLFFFIENSRKDVPESIIVQLTPGAFYVITSYFLLFCVFLQSFLPLFFTYFDGKVGKGSKDTRRIGYVFFFNLGISLFLVYFPYLSSLLIPLSLDTLTSYSQKTLSNFWIYSKLLNFEASVLLGLLFFYQFPCFLSFSLIEEKKNQSFSRIWREIIFYSFIIGAGITPSIDPITQIGCTIFTLLLYLHYSRLAQKKIKKKYLGGNFLG